jgi:cobaltochelatase CobS
MREAMNVPSELLVMLEEYVESSYNSPYNNRRNKLRAIADYLFSMVDDNCRNNLDRKVAEIKGTPSDKESLRPKFNSYRAHLSPDTLECLIYWCVNRIMLSHSGHSTANYWLEHWVTHSIDSLKGESDGCAWGSSKLITNWRDEDKGAVLKALMEKNCSDADLKKEIKRGADMSQVAITEMKIELDASHKTAIDAILSLSGAGSIDAINSQIDELVGAVAEAKADATLIATRLANAMNAVSAPTAVNASGVLPEGNVIMRKASEVFTNMKSSVDNTLLNFDVPTFEWEGLHPDVPVVDVNYKFDMTALFRVLQGIVDSNNSYLYGHTGTGKSTLVEQVCAHLKYPLVRVNFDSEISRMDLIGRDTLVTEDGQTVSKFVDGVLPDALGRPCLLLCDEVDFVRPDVMYVFQRVLEGNGLMISEDGGRKVIANPWFRLIATANTVGQGDETAMYQGARPLSMATLDRFENWVEMGYMKDIVETQWLKGVTVGLTDAAANLFIKYAKEHREAFTSGKIMQPLSPRGLRAMAKRFVTLKGLASDNKENIREAFEATVLARCTQQDKIVLDGLYQRVYK